jgi:uncharacterized membrane protein
MRLWLIPLAGLVTGLLLAIAVLAVDRSAGYDLVPQSITGNPAAASSLLATVITAVVTLLSVVLTVMTVAVQLAMGQFSPRIVVALLHDRLHQGAFALFGATVAWSIVALRGIDDQANVVPGLTVLVAYGLAIASLGVLVVYVAHAGDRLRADGLIDLVGGQLHAEILRRFPAGGRRAPVPADVVPSPRPGAIAEIPTRRLVDAAVHADCVLELCARMGDFVAAGAPLLRVHGGDPRRLGDVARLIELRGERTHDLDPAYGVRKLVDIAVRSAADDPTTTVEALHRIHDAMRQLAWRPFPTGRHADDAGRLRLIVPVRGWDDFVRLAFEEIRIAGAGQPQIARRLRAALEDLRSVVVDPDRRPVLDEHLELLEIAVRRRYEDDRAAAAALTPDVQGLG